MKQRVFTFFAGFFAVLPLAISSQVPAEESAIRWGPVTGHLKLGCEIQKTEWKAGEPIALTVHLRLGESTSEKVDVSFWGVFDLYQVDVLYGPSLAPVALTKEGRDLLDPDRYMGAHGATLTRDTRMTKELEVSKWWEVSTPGVYTVRISRRQPPANRRGFVVVKAPEVIFSVMSAAAQ